MRIMSRSFVVSAAFLVCCWLLAVPTAPVTGQPTLCARRTVSRAARLGVAPAVVAANLLGAAADVAAPAPTGSVPEPRIVHTLTTTVGARHTTFDYHVDHECRVREVVGFARSLYHRTAYRKPDPFVASVFRAFCSATLADTARLDRPATMATNGGCGKASLNGAGGVGADIDHGHIVAQSLGGNNDDPIQLWPQDSRSNRLSGRWYSFEMGLMTALRACEAALPASAVLAQLVKIHITLSFRATVLGTPRIPNGGVYRAAINTACWNQVFAAPGSWLTKLNGSQVAPAAAPSIFATVIDKLFPGATPAALGGATGYTFFSTQVENAADRLVLPPGIPTNLFVPAGSRRHFHSMTKMNVHITVTNVTPGRGGLACVDGFTGEITDTTTLGAVLTAIQDAAVVNCDFYSIRTSAFFDTVSGERVDAAAPILDIAALQDGTAIIEVDALEWGKSNQAIPGGKFFLRKNGSPYSEPILFSELSRDNAGPDLQTGSVCDLYFAARPNDQPGAGQACVVRIAVDRNQFHYDYAGMPLSDPAVYDAVMKASVITIMIVTDKELESFANMELGARALANGRLFGKLAEVQFVGPESSSDCEMPDANRAQSRSFAASALPARRDLLAANSGPSAAGVSSCALPIPLGVVSGNILVEDLVAKVIAALGSSGQAAPAPARLYLQAFDTWLDATRTLDSYRFDLNQSLLLRYSTQPPISRRTSGHRTQRSFPGLMVIVAVDDVARESLVRATQDRSDDNVWGLGLLEEDGSKEGGSPSARFPNWGVALWSGQLTNGGASASSSSASSSASASGPVDQGIRLHRECGSLIQGAVTFAGADGSSRQLTQEDKQRLVVTNISPSNQYFVCMVYAAPSTSTPTNAERTFRGWTPNQYAPYRGVSVDDTPLKAYGYRAFDQATLRELLPRSLLPPTGAVLRAYPEVFGETYNGTWGAESKLWFTGGDADSFTTQGQNAQLTRASLESIAWSG